MAAESAVRLAYYWYNLMPLSRGTAVTGLVALHALFLALDMPIRQSLLQVRRPPVPSHRACLQPSVGPPLQDVS